MIRRLDGWNVVLAGFWNRSIFLPEWVLPRLFPLHDQPGNEVETEVALLPALPLIYRDSQVALEISGGRLVVRPRDQNDECLLRCEAMARSMLGTLPETPVNAVGVNFAFRETRPREELIAIFTSGDDANLVRQNWIIGEQRLIRRLTRNDDALGLTMTFSDAAVNFDLNFHSEPGASVGAMRYGQVGRILRLREVVLDLLRETYQLELEDDNDGVTE